MAVHAIVLSVVVYQLLLPTGQANNASDNPQDGISTCNSTWTFFQNVSCRCGYRSHAVICDEDSLQVDVLKCFCMTYSRLHNMTLVGSCMYTCQPYQQFEYRYYRIPKNLQQLNNVTCGTHNRQGQMCSHCRDQYAPSVYSYDYYCVECTEYKYNWVKYLIIAYLPLTLMYAVTLCCKVSITRSSLYAHVLASQLLSTTQVAGLLDIRRPQTLLSPGQQSQTAIFRAAFTIYGIWNLDFGRSYYEPFCLHPDLTTHQVVALDYLIAVYPLLLILLTYFLVKLHDNYRLAVIIWSPCYWCIRRIQKEWNIKASLVDVFATFLLLSNVKLLNVSFDLISVPITLWNVTGQGLPQEYTYLNGSLEYLGREHLPYFVLGVAVILVFNVLPILLLCLYPFRCFQRCLNCCSLSSPSLHIFMDAFQGCYKTRPRDYRYMAAVPLIAMFFNFIIFSISPNSNTFVLLGCLFGILSFVVMACRPYQKNNYTYGLTYFFSTFLAISFSMNKEYLPSHTEFVKLGTYVVLRLGLLFFILITLSFLFGVIHHFISCTKLKISQQSRNNENVPLI